MPENQTRLGRIDEEYRKEAQRLKNEAQKQRSKLESQKEKIIRAANEKARELISNAKDEADAIIKEMRKMQKEGIEGQSLEEKRAKLKEKMAKVEKSLVTKSTHKVPKKLVKGDRVKIHSLNQSGIVTSPPNKNGDVTVKAGIMNINVNIKDLSLDESEEVASVSPKKFANTIARAKKANISQEIDLRGYMALEAIDKLDKYLDDAYISGISPVTIIHGKGTGALRSAIHEYLRTNPRVKKFRIGQYGEGESGVTIVEL